MLFISVSLVLHLIRMEISIKKPTTNFPFDIKHKELIFVIIFLRKPLQIQAL